MVVRYPGKCGNLYPLVSIFPLYQYDVGIRYYRPHPINTYAHKYPDGFPDTGTRQNWQRNATGEARLGGGSRATG